MPTLTVIIAAKEAHLWLPACIQSIIQQDLPIGWSFGISVGIDACPRTLEMARQLTHPQLAIRFFPTHVGPYIIFNSLALFDRSDVLVRFDADDIMLQGYLREQIRQLRVDLPPMIVQTWSIYVDAQLRPCRALLADGKMTGPDGRRFRPSDGQFLMTGAVLKRLGGFRAWLCHADSEFIQRAIWSGFDISTVSKHLYLRRVHAASLTGSQRTGYRSTLRRFYAEEIKKAGNFYARGMKPEYVSPPVAWYMPVQDSIWTATI